MVELVERASMQALVCVEINPIAIQFSDHGGPEVTRRPPLTIGCLARKPCVSE
jgi:hypothetical protein